MSTPIASIELQVPGKLIPGWKEGARSAFVSWGRKFVSDLQEQNLSGQHGDTGLNRRSGHLAQGWTSAASDISDGVEVRVWIAGPGAAYAHAQEVGGTIKPTNAHWLWIPLEANQTPAGIARVTPRDAINAPHFIRWDAPGGPTFFGKSIIKQTKKEFSKNFGIVPLFKLKKSVTLKPRMGAEKLWREEMDGLSADLAKLATEGAT